MAIADLDPAVRAQLDAYGLTGKIGADHIFATSADLVAAYNGVGCGRGGAGSDRAGAPAGRGSDGGADVRMSRSTG